VGTVYVNCYNAFASMTPFGGFKDYLELKTIIEKI
jgi:acyl-CoA reductase-like NAD-dependent aldehyde dehydrogenase